MQFSEQDAKNIKDILIMSLCDSQEVRENVIRSVPEYIRPYAHINPCAFDALEQIENVTKFLHPEITESYPLWIQKLIDTGFVDTDGKTVIAKSLEVVAREIMKLNIQVTNVMLRKFINGKTNKPYSAQSINLAIEYANAK